MTIPYSAFFERLLKATDIATQMDLARALGVNRSAITQAKLRDAVPQKWILALSRRYSLSPDWLEFGTGTARPERPAARKGGPAVPLSPATRNANATAPVPEAHARQPALFTGISPLEGEPLVQVPKAAARLCAGGGSYEVEALPVDAFSLPLRWLSKMGAPSAMIFMDVVGDSMEPAIRDGDMVLVDQSHTRIEPRGILAVGVEDAIYLKRVERKKDGIVLHSDNSAYAPMELYGDELLHFRLIGKVVWLCRDCRWA